MADLTGLGAVPWGQPNAAPPTLADINAGIQKIWDDGARDMEARVERVKAYREMERDYNLDALPVWVQLYLRVGLETGEMVVGVKTAERIQTELLKVKRA